MFDAINNILYEVKISFDIDLFNIGIKIINWRSYCRDTTSTDKYSIYVYVWVDIVPQV